VSFFIFIIIKKKRKKKKRERVSETIGVASLLGRDDNNILPSRSRENW
jgi:hypothetical protein